MQPAPLAGAVLPADVLEAQRPPGAQGFYTLADAKNTLGMRQEQADLDAYIQILVDTAAAILEQSTGLEFKAAPGAQARYIVNGRRCRALCIPESDVMAVTSVVEHPAMGDASTLDAGSYEVSRSFGRTYIARTDDEFFEASEDGVSVVVNYTRGVGVDSRQADLIVGGMAFLVKSLFDAEGADTPAMRGNVGFNRIVKLLKSQRSYNVVG